MGDTIHSELGHFIHHESAPQACPPQVNLVGTLSQLRIPFPN